MTAATPDNTALVGFQPATRAWFEATFGAPTPAQALAWPELAAGHSALVLAPTGGGKTLAAFLVALDRLLFAPRREPATRCRILYISPLKALAVDVDKNLRAPLAGIAAAARAAGQPPTALDIAVRTGDTPARERALFARHGADLLITTPESLFLLLTSQARRLLRAVETVIVDEVHALAGTKRGAHLALSLERLQALAAQPLQRIGLSATVAPVAEVAHYLGGNADTGEPRPVRVVEAGRRKPFAVSVVWPAAGPASSAAAAATPLAPQGSADSIWPALHAEVLARVRAARTTLIFVNSRRGAERLAAALNELAWAAGDVPRGTPLVRAHHGALARAERLEVEGALKAGRLRGLVATSSLELGIDMGTVDLVIQVEAPPAVTSAIQRIGRAGHRLEAPSTGVVMAKFRGDLLAAAAATPCIAAGAVEPLRMTRNALDVLAQQLVAMVAGEDADVAALERLVRRAAPYGALPPAAFAGVLDMLAGRYPAELFATLRPRLDYDRGTGRLTARPGARLLACANAGTIPDRGFYGVFLTAADGGSRRVGELDEEMVFELRVGEAFVLGASTWRCDDITHDRVLVTPAPGAPAKLPFWHGERAGRPAEFGRAIGALTRRLQALPNAEAERLLVAEHGLEPPAAAVLLAYLAEQRAATGAVPDDRTLVIEHFVDEVGDTRVCLLSPFGGRVHGPWATAIAARLSAERPNPVDVLWSDDGIVLRFPQGQPLPAPDVLLPDPDGLEALLVRQLGAGGSRPAAQHPLFAAKFREAAGRALLLPRRTPGRRTPLWQQRLRAAELLAVTAEYGHFPIVLEAYRECLQDLFDLPALSAVLTAVREGTIRVVEVARDAASPFAAALLFHYVASYMYENDAPLAERRAAALRVDPERLRELVGAVDLRDLLLPRDIAAHERELQGRSPARHVRTADGLHDLLLRIGHVPLRQLARHVAPPEAALPFVTALEAAGRLVRVSVAGVPAVIAIADAARYRDALGAALPADLPAAWLAPEPGALQQLLARYARTHGPFTTAEAAAHFGLGIDPAESALSRLEAQGRLTAGAFRRGEQGPEWCDPTVLRALRRLAGERQRRETLPVAPTALARLIVEWQQVAEPRPGRLALLHAIECVQGVALPAGDLETRILPARVADYDPRDLDLLMAAGEVFWTGAGAPPGGAVAAARVRLHRAAEAGSGAAPGPSADAPTGPLHARLRETLATRGALFYGELLRALGGFPGDVLRALWDLVWAGEVTNDTLAPLRALLRPKRPSARPGAARPGVASLEPTAAGRFSLVGARFGAAASPTEQLAARVQALLSRHGVLVRDAVAADGLPGGFAAAYPVLRAAAEAGRLRRGYFVAGAGAAQFALPAALERLRCLRAAPGSLPRALLIAAADPANPYGALLPWPESPGARRPARLPGATAVLVDGALVAWRAARDPALLIWLDTAVPGRKPEAVAEALAAALAADADAGQPGARLLASANGVPLAATPLREPLRAAGFRETARGFLRGRAG